jgi:hypothetical protein
MTKPVLKIIFKLVSGSNPVIVICLPLVFNSQQANFFFATTARVDLEINMVPIKEVR